MRDNNRLIAILWLTVVGRILTTKVEQNTAEIGVSECHTPILEAKAKASDLPNVALGPRGSRIQTYQLPIWTQTIRSKSERRHQMHTIMSLNAQCSTKAIRESRETSTRCRVCFKHDQWFIVGD